MGVSHDDLVGQTQMKGESIMRKWRSFFGISLSVAMLVTSVQPIQMRNVSAAENISGNIIEQSVSGNNANTKNEEETDKIQSVEFAINDHVKAYEYAPGYYASAKPGEMITLQTQVQSESGSEKEDIIYSWYKDSVQLEGQTEPALQITADKDAAGNYTCRVSDANGSQEASCQVRVNNNLTVNPSVGTLNSSGGTSTVYADFQKSVTLSVEVDAYDKEGISYQWSADNIEIEGATDATYQTDAIEKKTYYYCEVTDPYGGYASMRFAVKIQNSFKLVIDGTDGVTSLTQTVKSGETVTLKGKLNVDESTDTTQIRYTWKKDGSVITDAVTDTYEASESGSYRLTAEDQYGNSSSIKFELRYSDSRVDSPSLKLDYNVDVLVKAGEKATLSVAAITDNGAVVEYRWYKGYDYNNEPIEGATGDTLETEEISQKSTYTCKVVASNGTKTTTSYAYFYVSVDNGFQAYAVAENGKRQTGSLLIGVTAGQKMVLKTAVSANDKTGLTYTWSKGGVTDENAKGDTYETAEITENTVYCCYVADQYGNGQMLTFNLVIDNALKVTAVGSTEVIKAPDAEAEIRVAVEANDKTGLTYVWGDYYNKSYIQNKFLSYDSGNTYIAQAGYTTPYCPLRCTVTDRYGNSDFVDFNVIADNDFTAEAVTSNQIAVKKGETVTLQLAVNAKDDSKFTYTWTKSTDRDFEATGKLYHAGNIEWTTDPITAYTTYTCSVSDVYYNLQQVSFKVFVENNFTVEAVGDAEKTVAEGEGVTLQVKATADDETGMTYQWYKQYYNETRKKIAGSRLSGQTGDALQLTADDLSGAVSAVYYCIVKDVYGNPRTVYFTVHVTTDAITKAAEQEITADNVDDALNELKTKGNDQLVAELQEADAVEALGSIEETYKEAHDITEKAPESNVTEIDKDKIEVTGAALNVEDEGASVTLKVEPTKEQPEIDETDFKIKNMIVFDMSVVAKKADGTAADVDFSKELAIPVTVTLPIPEKLNIDKVKIFHQQSDGTMEEVDARIDKENRTAIFTVTHFSVFAFVDELLAQLGDINGDGEVNAKDRMYLARALAGWEGYTVPGIELADFNGDGEVNAKDRMYLARKVAGWDGYQ